MYFGGQTYPHGLNKWHYKTFYRAIWSTVYRQKDPIASYRHCQENFQGVGTLFSFFTVLSWCRLIQALLLCVCNCNFDLLVIGLLSNFYFSSFTLVRYLVSRDPSLSPGHPICCHIITSNNPLGMLSISEPPIVMSPLLYITALISVAD